MTADILLFGFPDDLAHDLLHSLKQRAPQLTICAGTPAEAVAGSVLIVHSDHCTAENCLATNATQILSIGTQAMAIIPPPDYRHLRPPLRMADVTRTLLDWAGHQEEESVIALPGDWEFHRNLRLLQHREYAPVELTDKEAGLLEHLLAHSPHTVDRDSLLRDIWGYDEDIDTHTLETHIYRLRSKLSELMPKGMGLLTTDDGYRFVR